jgi:hypothetical protein
MMWLCNQIQDISTILEQVFFYFLNKYWQSYELLNGIHLTENRWKIFPIDLALFCLKTGTCVNVWKILGKQNIGGRMKTCVYL